MPLKANTLSLNHIPKDSVPFTDLASNNMKGVSWKVNDCLFTSHSAFA